MLSILLVIDAEWNVQVIETQTPLDASPFEINRIGLSMLLTAVASLSVAHTLRSCIPENAFGDAAKMIADEPNRYYMV